MELGKKIKELRIQHEMSQEDLADALGVSRQAVSKWETGLSMPDSKNILQLAKLFSISADELIENKYSREKMEYNRSPLKIILVCLFQFAVITGIALCVFFLKQDVPPQESGEVANTLQTVSGEDLPASEGNQEGENNNDPDEAGSGYGKSSERTVYIAFTALMQEELTPEEAYGCREQIFAGLQSMDWIAYGTLGEAGKYFETAEALQIWLAEQETLSKKEILGLQMGCMSNLDGAYSENYANALANALMLYPREFVEAMSAEGANEENSNAVVSLTAYGAVIPEERYQKVKEELTYLIQRSGALNEASEEWAVKLYDKLLELY